MRAKRTSRLKVLLAWDIEDPAPAALVAVRRLIEGGAKAEAVHVASPAFSSMAEWDRRTLRAAWREKLRKQGVDLKFVDGGVVPRLLAYIKERRPDLVVLGTKSSGWIESLLLGSVAKAVRRRSAAPVLIVPARKRG
jgi:nucleotide-binding universal stress UspA family protein